MASPTPTSQGPNRLVTAITPPLILLGLMWAAWLLSAANLLNPAHWGIIPRTLSGLWGIITSPLVHGGISHLLSNTLPFFFLLSLLFFFYKKIAWEVLVMGWLITGACVWAAARSSSHIGASGLVYCFAAFLFFIGVFRRDVASMALALLVVLVYGSMVWGVLPIQPGVSWESHLFGAIAGAAIAWYARDKHKPAVKKYSWEQEPESAEGDENALWNFQKKFNPPADIES